MPSTINSVPLRSFAIIPIYCKTHAQTTFEIVFDDEISVFGECDFLYFFCVLPFCLFFIRHRFLKFSARRLTRIIGFIYVQCDMFFHASLCICMDHECAIFLSLCIFSFPFVCYSMLCVVLCIQQGIKVYAECSVNLLSVFHSIFFAASHWDRGKSIFCRDPQGSQ